MGLFPFASTVGSISNSSTEPANARGMRVLTSVSCFGAAKRGWIHGTHGERGPVVERSPP